MYEALYRHYDLFMQEADHIRWTDYLESFISGKRCGADVFCGTGKITIELNKRGYIVLGFDLSPEMLGIATDNALKAGTNVNFIRQNAADFDAGKPKDFIFANCDGVNYLKDPLTFFRRTFFALDAGGVFVFDISSAYKLINILGNNTFSETLGDITYIWKNFYDRKNACIEMDLDFFEKTCDLYRKTGEKQIQYIHDKEDIVSKLAEAGFKQIECFTAFTRKRAAAGDHRMHFAAWK